MRLISESLLKYLRNYLQKGTANFEFIEDRRKLVDQSIVIQGRRIPVFINEFWTARQRQASSIHEISYRACFKPQLPRFFILLLSQPGDVVYDPFSGRGTTVIEAGLLNRRIVANDLNPLSQILTAPRFFIPSVDAVEERLKEIPRRPQKWPEIDLSMFFHPDTFAEICALREYLVRKEVDGLDDWLDHWIRMVATNRLTGHSPGFFSVYTLPPNQAVTPERQIKINTRRNQEPEYRDTHRLIIRKTKSLLRNLTPMQVRNLRRAGESALFLKNDARQTLEIPPESVDLIVTSPPFLNVVQYDKDNWLRCWFNRIDAKTISQNLTMTHTIEKWSIVMQETFRELFRVTRSGGWVAFEVGEVRKGTVKLEEIVVPLGISVGFECVALLINSQKFTKTANIWGVSNNRLGTNTNRIVLFRK